MSTAATSQRTTPSPRMAVPDDDGLDRRLDSVIAEAESALKGRRRHHPVRIHPAHPLSRRDRRGGAAQGRQLPARHSGRAWRLGAVLSRRLQHQRQRQGVLCPEAVRRGPRRPAYAEGPRRHPGAWRRCHGQCLRAHGARAVRPGALAGGAQHARRDHVPAALVSLSYQQGVLLVAHGDRAAGGADGTAAAGAQPARGRHPRAVRRAARPARALPDQPDGLALGRDAAGRRQAAEEGRAAVSQAQPQAGDRARDGLVDRAAERRRRARRHLSGDGCSRHVLRRARLSEGRSPRRAGEEVGSQAADLRRRARLLPALRVADLGHRAGGACSARRRRGRRRQQREAGARLAGRAPGDRRGRRLGGAAPRPAAGRLGLSIRQPALSRRRRHRRGGDGARPGRRAGAPGGDPPRHRLDHRHAVEEWRLGRLRRRQPPTSARAASAC